MDLITPLPREATRRILVQDFVFVSTVVEGTFEVTREVILTDIYQRQRQHLRTKGAWASSVALHVFIVLVQAGSEGPTSLILKFGDLLHYLIPGLNEKRSGQKETTLCLPLY